MQSVNGSQGDGAGVRPSRARRRRAAGAAAPEAAVRQPPWRDLWQDKRRLQTLAYEITVAEARERERIARGLHDEIGQMLTMASFKLGELRQPGVAERDVLLNELGTLLRQATQATRSATFELSCPLLQLGLQEAIESLAQRLARDSGMAVQVDGEVPPLAAPEPVLAVVFRVVRELCLNVRKHAAARHVRIGVHCADGRLSICVADDGRGFAPAGLPQGVRRNVGFGLFSAEAQMQAIGGRVEIESAPGQGTRATVVLSVPSG
ncbi:sensor histidine kinase [Piscinibacter sp.]|uniref:sensor histidine kinase n=1 Tax=Piscinibacter sp. TaxID=1903157 RepID=UPI002C097C75|nr:ATP-binding protein [Albitalea sp.]HUG26181.1 ATP-binding protein [Albitalea sp.]